MKKLVFSLLLTVFIAAPAFAQMMDRPMMGHREGHGQMMKMGNMDMMDDMMCMCIEDADQMGLTDDQLMKIKPIHREMEKKLFRFIADQKIAEIELMEIMEVKDFDIEKAGAAVKNIAEISTAHQLEMLKSSKAMRAILTNEQFKKMQKKMSTMPMKIRENRHEKMMNQSKPTTNKPGPKKQPIK